MSVSPINLDLPIAGMTGEACAARLDKALGQAQGVLAVDVDLARECAAVAIDEQATDVGALGETRRAPALASGTKSAAPPASKRESYLLRCLASCPQVLDSLPKEELARFHQAIAGTGLLAEVVDFIQHEPSADTGTLLGRFVGDDAYPHLASLAQQPPPLGGNALAAEFAEAVRLYDEAHERKARATLVKRIQQSESEEDLRRLHQARTSRLKSA